MTNETWGVENTPGMPDRHPPSRLAIATGYDRKNRHDATGAFRPESARWADLTDDDRRPVYVYVYGEHVRRDRAFRRNMAEAWIREAGGPAGRLETLAVFGHGTAKSLLCTGHSIAHVVPLAEAIGDASESIWGDLTVLLYACTTARGRRGFADHLADLLAGRRRGRPTWVWGHTTAGHTTWNPYVELAGGPHGGRMIVEPGEPLWPKWMERLREDQDFRLSWWRIGGIDAIREAVG